MWCGCDGLEAPKGPLSPLAGAGPSMCVLLLRRHPGGVKKVKALLWQERLREGVLAQIRQWQGDEDFTRAGLVLRNMHVLTNPQNLLRAREVFPAGDYTPESSLALSLEGVEVRFFVSPTTDVEGDTLYFHGGPFPPQRAFLSSLPAAAHEVYVRLRQDGVSPQEAHALSALLGAS